VPVSSSRTKARGSPVAAQKKRMIQRSAEQTLSRASAGNPKGPIPKETRVTAVAAKKKIEAIAMRRRSSWAASLAQTAQARANAEEPEVGRRETEDESGAELFPSIVYCLLSTVSRPNSTTWSGSMKSRGSLEARTTRPSLRLAATVLSTIVRPSVSSPIIGSSKSSAGGSKRRANAIFNRCFIPVEKAPTRFPRAPASPTSARRRVRSSASRGWPPARGQAAGVALELLLALADRDGSGARVRQ